jgi:quercetin dioxygenase-like cupin family protein
MIIHLIVTRSGGVTWFGEGEFEPHPITRHAGWRETIVIARGSATIQLEGKEPRTFRAPHQVNIKPHVSHEITDLSADAVLVVVHYQ